MTHNMVRHDGMYINRKVFCASWRTIWCVMTECT